MAADRQGPQMVGDARDCGLNSEDNWRGDNNFVAPFMGGNWILMFLAG